MFAPSLLTLEGVRRHLALVAEFRIAHPVLAGLTYMACYILAAVLALPGVLVISISGGALFGFWQGLLLTSFASALGATLALKISRSVLRPLLADRFASTLAVINHGLTGSGWVYLASLRLVPTFPYALVNLLFGVTNFPVGLFYLVSQIFMLPATLVYVNAGTELGSLNSLSDILSATMLGALLLLALLAPLSRLMLRGLQR
jgi:uncharacterized membrane protein YdjX (TVP38/TMEM64 family)